MNGVWLVNPVPPSLLFDRLLERSEFVAHASPECPLNLQQNIVLCTSVRSCNEQFGANFTELVLPTRRVVADHQDPLYLISDKKLEALMIQKRCLFTNAVDICSRKL